MAGEKSVRLSITGNNLDAKAKLEEIDRKAEELAHEHPELSIGINTAAAAEKLAILRAELKKTKDEAAGSKTSLKGVMAGLFDFASGGVSGGWGEMNLFQKAIAGVGLATGIAEPAVAGLTVVAAGLSSGIAAAGLGLGVFGLVAKSVYGQVSTAVQAFETAQSTTGKASAAAMKRYYAYMGALTPAQQAVARSITGAEGAWQGFVNKNTAGVGIIMSQGIGLLPKVFAAMQPFLAPTEKALSGIITSLGKGMDSAGFKNFIGAFAANSGKDLTNIAGAIGHVVVGLFGILKAFLPMSTTMTGGLDSLTEKFAKWGTTLSSHSGFKALITEATQEGPKVASALKNIGEAVKNLLGDMAGMTTMSNSTLLWDMLNPLTGIIKLLSGNPKLIDLALWGYAAYSSLNKVVGLKNGVMGLWTEFGKLGTALTPLAAKLGLVTIAEGEGEAAQIGFNMALLASPITWIVLGLVAVGVGIYELTKHSEAFRAFWKAAWKDITAAAEAAFNWVKHNWPLIGAILLGPIAVAAFEIYKHWGAISRGAEVMFHAIAGWFSRLPATLLGYVKSFGSLLENAGVNLISGLMSGIDHEAGALWSKITGIGGKISSVFKSALSIFSPSRVFMEHGKNIVLGLIGGIDGYAHLAENSVRNLAQRAIHASGGRFVGAAGSNGNSVLQIEWVGGAGADQEFITWLKKQIRIRGGNPAVLGR